MTPAAVLVSTLKYQFDANKLYEVVSASQVPNNNPCQYQYAVDEATAPRIKQEAQL